MSLISTNSFTPSFLARGLGELAAPRALVAYSTLGLSYISGLSWPVSVGLTGLALLAQKGVSRLISGGEVLRSAVFIEADHLANFSIQGGIPPLIIPFVLQALDSFDSPDCKCAKALLQGLLNYEKFFNYLGFNGALTMDLADSLAALQPGEQMAFPLSWMHWVAGGHIIIGSAERKADGTFCVRFHNGGDGLAYHYHRYEKETGNLLYQTTLEIDDIKQENLISFIMHVASFHEFGSDHNSSKVYESISLLKGKILPADCIDSRLWSRDQQGMSCSGYSIRCFLKSLLTVENFQAFEKQFLILAAQKLKEGFTNGMFWDATAEHHLAYSELRAKIVRMGEKDPGAPPEGPPPLLGRASSKVQRLFWGIFFPLLHKQPSARTYSSFDLRPLGRHKPFRLLNASFEKIKNLENSCLRSGCLKYPPQLPKARDRALESLRTMYDSIDRSKRSKINLQEIDKHFTNICQSLEEANSLQIYSGSYRPLALNEFYGALFSYFPQEKLRSRGARRLLEGINDLRAGRPEKARPIFEEIYREVEATPRISSKYAKEYEYVMMQMLYADRPVRLEDIELYAAAAIIFTKVQQKTSSMETVSYLSYLLNTYRTLRLDLEFPASPWGRAIFDEHLPPQWAPERILPKPGPELAILLAK